MAKSTLTIEEIQKWTAIQDFRKFLDKSGFKILGGLEDGDDFGAIRPMFHDGEGLYSSQRVLLRINFSKNMFFCAEHPNMEDSLLIEASSADELMQKMSYNNII